MKWLIWHIESSIDTIKLNKFRSLLTTLGIVFGVSSVICMMAIGKGTEKEILDQIESIGAKTIIIKSEITNGYNNNSQNKISIKQLTTQHLQSIQEIIPSIKHASPYVESECEIIYQNQLNRGKIAGISNDFFIILNFEKQGRYFHSLDNSSVCLINRKLASELFIDINPLGKSIRVENNIFQIVGVVEKQSIEKADNFSFTGSGQENTIYLPFHIYKSRIPKKRITDNSSLRNNNSNISGLYCSVVDKIILQVNSIEHLSITKKMLDALLITKLSAESYNIIIPLEILKQHQKSKRIFSIVLGLIAGISLLVGGIGIMNIMMASVYERISEIGIRMAVGASKHDIQYQFLMESSLICLIGGIIGVFVGVFSSIGISYFSEIRVVISVTSIFMAFVISIFVGIISGIIPAQKAANQNPVESIRHE